MKKGLSLLLAASMAVSTFASAAFAADELTAQEKFDALVEAGIFTGMPGGDAALEEAMTRAQVAAIVFRLLGLQANEAGAAVYTDLVGAEWAAGYIGAITPEYMEGYGNGKFAPSDTFTYEQLATVLVRVLDLDVDAAATVDGNVSDWAQANVAAAVAAGVIKAQADYTVPALREALVETAYAANAALNPPVQKEVKLVASQAGAKTITVDFGAPVDKTKASFALKRGAMNVAATAEFNEAGTAATLTTNDKLATASYTLTVSGVEGLTENTVQIAAVAEAIAAIELTGDVLPISAKTEVPFAVKNQFGEKMSVAPNSNTLTWIYSNAVAKNANTDKGAFVDLDEAGTNNGFFFKADDALTVTVVANNGMQASRTYKIGAPAVITTVDLIEVVNDNDKAVRLSADDTAAVKYEIKDQYGNLITDLATLSDPDTGVRLIVSQSVVEAEWVPGKDDKAKLELDLEKVTTDTTIVLTAVTPAGQTKSISFNVYKKAAIDSFDVGSPTGVVADGDKNIYLPLSAVDQFGEVVSAKKIAEDYAAAADKKDLIKIFDASTSVTIADADLSIETAKGDNQGKLKIANISGTGSVTITVVSATGKTDSVTFNVEPARSSSKVEISKPGAATLLLDAKTTVELKIFDQYGQEFKTDDADVHAVVEVVKGSDGKENGLTHNIVVDGDKKILDEQAAKKITLTANEKGSYTLNVKLIRSETVNGNTTTSTLSTVSKTFKVIDGKEQGAALTYSVADIPTLYGVQDNALKAAYSHELKVTATDAAGNEVAIPNSFATVKVSNENVDLTVTDNVYKINGVTRDKSAIVTIIVNTPQGNQVVTKTVSVSKDELAAETVKPNKTELNLAAGTYDLLDKDGKVFFEVVDQFGGKALSTMDELDFVITNDQNATVTVLNNASSATFTAISGKDTTYTITAVTTNGKSVIIKVVVDA